MDLFTTICIICSIYGVLLFFDMFFKSCCLHPYITLMKSTGVRIQCLQLTWTTTAFNRLILRWGNTNKLNAWFTFGMYITLILLPTSVIILVIALYQNFTNDSGTKQSVIEPILPGVNLPGNEVYYYTTSLIVSSVIHELGHGLASVKEDVHIINVGLKLIFILPIAYVNLSTESLKLLNSWKALKIFTAGIWHNLMLSFTAFILYSLLPFIYSALFYTNSGVLVVNFSENSPLQGTKGLQINDVIKSINNCPVSNEADMYKCLLEEKRGYCIDANIVHDFDESVPLKYTNYGLDCCDGLNSANLCFEYLENNNGVLEMPPHCCLPARLVVENAKLHCTASKPCPHQLHCLKPLLDNQTTLFKIERTITPNIIYIGHPSDFVATLTTSSYIPKFGVLSQVFAPDIVLKFLEYLIVISTGLALINTIPCLFMDGNHIMYYVIDLLCNNSDYSKVVTILICTVTTMLLLLHCLYALWLRIN